MTTTFQNEKIERDLLYVGLTRPPMLAGITDVYAVFFLIMEVLIFVGVGGGQGLTWAIIMAPVLYCFGYLMCLHDPRIFQIWQVRLSRFGAASRRKKYWGGPSFDPS